MAFVGSGKFMVHGYKRIHMYPIYIEHIVSEYYGPALYNSLLGCSSVQWSGPTDSSAVVFQNGYFIYLQM